MISKVREEMDDENKFSEIKKEHQYQVMQKLMAESEEKNRKIIEEKEKDRLTSLQ